MQRVKMTCAYDGSAYCGWQRQSNVRSIQEVIEDVLAKMHRHPVTITASGRTDTHVHALGQVFHFDSEKDLDEAHWQAALNSMLPKDIRIQRAELVDTDFHARFSAVRKCYDYWVSNRVNDPFVQRYMAVEREPLDIAYMQECASVFIGTHDFTSFTSAKIDPRKPRVKTIDSLTIQAEYGAIRMRFVGNGFLRYMVRMLAQTLMEAGKHRITKEEIAQMLASQDKHVCRYKAVPQGLYLVWVSYGGSENESELSYAYETMSSCDRQ